LHHSNLGLRGLAVALVGALGLLAACGSGDESAAADDAAGDGGGIGLGTSDPDGPDATVAPDLPAAYVGVVGPLEVIGDALPLLVSDDFSADPAVGMPAPVLVGLDYDGNTVRLDATRDGATMVVFLAHWCPHCNEEIPVINQLRDGGRIPDDVSVVAVSTAVNPGQPNFPPGEWLVDRDWTFPVIADGVNMEKESYIAAEAYGVGGFPFVALIDDAGNIAARWSGGREPSEIASLLAALPAVA
jgi:thiol-disulfide isomerase/thioredoxin